MKLKLFAFIFFCNHMCSAQNLLREDISSCLEKNNEQACLRVSEAFFKGNDIERNVEMANDFKNKAASIKAKQLELLSIESACRSGSKKSCEVAAKIWQKGEGVEKNINRALEYLDLAKTASDGSFVKNMNFGIDVNLGISSYYWTSGFASIDATNYFQKLKYNTKPIVLGQAGFKLSLLKKEQEVASFFLKYESNRFYKSGGSVQNDPNIVLEKAIGSTRKYSDAVKAAVGYSGAKIDGYYAVFQSGTVDLVTAGNEQKIDSSPIFVSLLKLDFSWDLFELASKGGWTDYFDLDILFRVYKTNAPRIMYELERIDDASDEKILITRQSTPSRVTTKSYLSGMIARFDIWGTVRNALISNTSDKKSESWLTFGLGLLAGPGSVDIDSKYQEMFSLSLSPIRIIKVKSCKTSWLNIPMELGIGIRSGKNFKLQGRLSMDGLLDLDCASESYPATESPYLYRSTNGNGKTATRILSLAQIDWIIRSEASISYAF